MKLKNKKSRVSFSVSIIAIAGVGYLLDQT